MRLHGKGLGFRRRLGVTTRTIIGGLSVLLIIAAVGCDDKSKPTGPTTARESPGTDVQTQQVDTPTTTPTPQLPGSITPVPASESYRLDLGAGVVVAFVEGLSPEQPDKVAYVTHVPSGSQAVLDRDGQIIDRHDGQGDGPGRLDAVLEDGAEMDRILKGLKSDEDVRPRETVIDWVPLIQFGGIHYLARWRLAGQTPREGDRDLTVEDLGREFYRIAFRGDGYVGGHYRYQDGDSTYLDPGTPVYAVKGYVPEFRLATLEEGEVRLFEADTNPLARTGEDLLDIRGKVTAIDILSEEDSAIVLGTIDEEGSVNRFVEAVLESPVDQGSRNHEGERYFLGFRLADGTSVVRSFWLESRELWRGIMTDAVVAAFVRSALSKEDTKPTATTSVQWGGGTGVHLNTPSASPGKTDAVHSGTEQRIQLPQAVEQALGAQPSPDWALVEAPGLADQPGFSLRLPTGWELRETQPLDSYVGELGGDGVKLRFDYGRFSPSLDPASDPEHIYVLRYEAIGGYEAKLVIPLDTSGGLTGVHFRAIDGLRLTLWGEDLTPDQQRTALAILRTIRSSNEAAGRSPEESGASKPTPRLIIRRGSMSAAHERIRYEAVAGPIRAELLDTERLEPTGLGLWDVQLQKGDEGRRVYALPGVPLERGFLVRSAEKGVYSDIWYFDPETAYPVCQPGARNFFFVAKGASPQPTPVPTPDTSGISTVLSSEGLLGAGWPLVNMANLQIEFRGVEYTYADRSYSGGYVPIEELETLAIAYPVEIGRLPYPALEELATGGMVVDHVRIYRFSERPINEVIVIDQCPSDLRGDHFVLYLPTRGGSNDNDGDSSSVPTPTPEPRPVSFDDHVMPPEYVRLDFDNQIVVAFVDDQGLGRVAYVTHVPTGAQAVLNNKGKVVERHSGTGNGDAILEVTLSDADAMSQIQGGFLYEEDLPGNGFMDWVNFIRFGGSEYLSKGKRGGGDQVEKSRLGEVLYRVAFHVDANLVPGDYRPRAGDAAFLSPGTAIHSVDGYSPSEVLAAVVDGEVWLFDRPGPAISIPTPAVVPGEPQIDRHEEAEQRLRRAMANFPAGHIDWVDGDTVVYVLAADPHDLAGTKVAVAHYLPTSAAITYSLNKVENRWSLLGTRCPSIPTPAVWSTGSVEASSGPLGTTRYELSMCCEG